MLVGKYIRFSICSKMPTSLPFSPLEFFFLQAQAVMKPSTISLEQECVNKRIGFIQVEGGSSSRALNCEKLKFICRVAAAAVQKYFLRVMVTVYQTKPGQVPLFYISLAGKESWSAHFLRYTHILLVTWPLQISDPILPFPFTHLPILLRITL